MFAGKGWPAPQLNFHVGRTEIVDIALSKDVSVCGIRACLTVLLPGVALDVRTLDSPEQWRSSDVDATLMPNDSEFPCGLGIGVRITDGSRTGEWLRELARQLSIHFSCRVVCDGTGFGDDDSPYWAIVWDCGAAFLANDCGTTYADGEGGPVKLVRPLPGMANPDQPVDLVACVRRESG